MREFLLCNGSLSPLDIAKVSEVSQKISPFCLTAIAEDGEILKPIGGAGIVDFSEEAGNEEEWGELWPYELSVLELPRETFLKYWRKLDLECFMLNPEKFDELLVELETTADAFWNVSRENAQFLSLLIKATRAKRVLEVGTSNGYSTLWFARALVEAGAENAEVVAIEFDAGRAALARGNYERAGIGEIITLHEGDARTILSTLEGPFDFVFLDAEKPEYAEYLRAVLPLVRPNGLIVGDDTISLRDKMADYVALAFDHPELESVDVPIDDGVIISRKKG